MDAKIKPHTELFSLTELYGQIKLTELFVNVCVCVFECAYVGTLLVCNSDAFCCSEGCAVCLAALNFHTQCQQLPSNYRKPALRECLWENQTMFSFFVFVWSKNDIIKYE